MSPLAGTKHTYVRLAIIIYCLYFSIDKITTKAFMTSQFVLEFDTSSVWQKE